MVCSADPAAHPEVAGSPGPTSLFFSVRKRGRQASTTYLWREAISPLEGVWLGRDTGDGQRWNLSRHGPFARGARVWGPSPRCIIGPDWERAPPGQPRPCGVA